MTDPLLPWYERELEFFRQMGEEFARSKPKIAARLSLNSVGNKDPHVERMVQSFAYLNARIRYKLDDDYPELTDAMLGVLYPHFLQPTPSIASMRFALDKGQGDLTSGYPIPRGTAVESEPVGDHVCRFRTTSDVTLYPLHLSDVKLRSRPFVIPASERANDAEGLLHLRMRPFAAGKSMSAYNFDKLRFHIHLPQFHQAAAVYELLFDSVLGVVVASDENERDPIVLPAAAVRPAGFGLDESLLPYSARAFPGYRLLTEYFAFPRKFLYFDVEIGAENLARLQNTMEIFILLGRSQPDLEQIVREDSIQLGCTPIVNLFDLTSDAVTLNERKTEYRIIPDARRESAVEIYSVNHVSVSDQHGDERQFQPFYSVKHASDGDARSFWYATRRPGPTAGDFAPSPHGGTEMYVTLVDTSLSPLQMARGTLHSKVTCFNRDVPGRLPFGGGRPRFELPDGRGPISGIVCLTAPTPTWRPTLGRQNLWRLISQLSLNHLSLDGSEEAVTSLQEMLRLYDLRDSRDTRDMIEGVVRIESRRTVARVGGTFARGTEISLLFDDEKYTGSSPYLLASVLNEFFGMYSSINSFTRLVATTLAKQSRDEVWEWKPRASDRALI